MPLITPSRLAIIVVFSFSLLTFLWTFGVPSQLAQPEVPVIDHYDHKNVHTDPIIPAPVIETPHATLHEDRPTESDDHRWDDQGHAAAPAPTGTGVAEFEEDGGRWEDAAKKPGSGKGPSTLLTHTVAVNKPTVTEAPVPIPPASTQAVEKFCQNLTMAQDVMVVLKTSKAYIDKLDAHLRTFISCVPTFAIFSDHEGEFQGHKVHDALRSVSHEIKFSHDEFHEYRLIRADAQHKPDAEKLQKLDKWKMLPMVYRAYHMKPDARFIVFIEEETTLSWTNLLQWLSRLDYRIPYYSGAPAYISGTQSAQRGPGIMLSQGALRRFAKSYDEVYTSKWERAVDKECCGDLMLSRALAEAHVEFYTSWPLLQPERPDTLDYTKRHWCTPAVSWHGIDDKQLAQQWELEKKWTSTHGWNKPYLYRDAFEDYVAPHVENRKEGWDNLSHDAKIIAPAGRQKQIKDEADKMKLQEEERKKQEALKEEKERKEQGGSKQSLEEAHKDDIFQVAGHRVTPNQKRAQKDQDKDKKKKVMPNWDKIPEKHPNAADGPEMCQQTCKDVEDCLQWRYSREGDGQCYLSKVMRVGNKDDNAKWTSGWMVDRIQAVKTEWQCKKAEWKFYQ